MQLNDLVSTDSVEKEAWAAIENSILYYRGRPVGTLAAYDVAVEALNYDQCFVRDFVSSALIFLIKGRTDIVRNFLEETLRLQPKERQLNAYMPGRGLMPASFKVVCEGEEEYLEPDFGEHAIARVTPVDSCLWWVILLRAYVVATRDFSLAYQPDFQHGLRLIMELCLATRFDMYPTLLVPDGACMIDRRMGIFGHPLEIQSLFFAALRAARELLVCQGNEDIVTAIDNRLPLLQAHIRQHYWMDLHRLNKIYRFKSEEYGKAAANPFNVYADSLPYYELDKWLPRKGGYLVGNVGPSQLDTRFFCLANMISIPSRGTIKPSKVVRSSTRFKILGLKTRLEFDQVLVFQIAHPLREMQRLELCTKQFLPFTHMNNQFHIDENVENNRHVTKQPLYRHSFNQSPVLQV